MQSLWKLEAKSPQEVATIAAFLATHICVFVLEVTFGKRHVWMPLEKRFRSDC